MPDVDFSEIFPVGSCVFCENEMYQGKWNNGVVDSHGSWAIRIRIESSDETENGMLVDYDYCYLDTNPHNSLVRLRKEPTKCQLLK